MRHLMLITALLLACGDDTEPTETDTDTDTDADTDTDTDTDLPVQWKDRGIETSATLYAVYTGGTGALVAGTDGALYTISSGGSTQVYTGMEEDIQGMWGAGDDTNASLVMVGTSGLVATWTSAAGFAADDLGTANFFDVDGTPDALTAVSWAGVYDYDGGGWEFSELPAGPGVKALPNAVHVGQTSTWVAGEDGYMARRVDGVWEALTPITGQDLQAIHGIAEDDLWAVGTKGKVMHWDGAEWTELDAGVSVNLWGVWQADTGEVFIVGSNGTALLYHEEAFTSLNTDSQANLYAVYGTGWSNVWAVGNRGEVLRYTGPVE